MRYYLYIDKEFLQTLISVFDDTDFNIEVVEFSIRKSFTKNNGFLIDPCVENISQCEEFSREGTHDDNGGKKKDSVGKEKLGARFDHGNSYNVQTEKRYLNIEDITSMKNIHFYHKLLEKIRNMGEECSRIIEECGYIKVNKSSDNILNSNNVNDDFFMVNDCFIWIDKSKLRGDLNLLSEMSCNVRVIGYMMNCENIKCNNIIKAIAIFIE